ncbi:MAG: hypothetical protein ACFFBD_07780 [Candidatus Hodarchaeota archaeon]
MPICQKCGGYFVRAPCPYCNPPEETAAKPAAPAISGSVEELYETLQRVETEMNALIEESEERRVATEIKMNKMKGELGPKNQELQEVKSELAQVQRRFDDVSSQVPDAKINELEKQQQTLLNQIKEKDTKITELQENKVKIEKIQKEIDGFESKINDLKEQISAQDKEIAELEAQL